MTTEATETTSDSASIPEAGDAAVLAAAREAMGKPIVEAQAAELAAAREQLAKEVRAEHAAAFKSRMRTQPVETLTEYEVEGVDLVRRIAERAGPQGQSLTELAQLREELAAIKGGGGAVPK